MHALAPCSHQPTKALGYSDHGKFRTLRGGEIIAGHYFYDGQPLKDVESFYFPSTGAQLTLIYCRDRYSSDVLLGTYSEQGQPVKLPAPFYSFVPNNSIPISRIPWSWHFSYAPLENVQKVRAFYSEGGIRCKGMLIEYANGGQRAVGQCRLLVDPCKVYRRPSSISFQKTWRHEPASPDWVAEVSYHRGVQFDVASQNGFSSSSWAHFAMAGTLRFWFTASSAFMSISGGHRITIG
ncbi:hypothetical protein VTK56DRAFT_1162 [Thermocarpiscus australiensis]